MATLTNICIVGGGQGDLYKINSVPYGSVTRRCYHSPGNGTSRRITISTPPCYEFGKDKYQVLYLLHHMGGDEEAWMSLGRVSQRLDNLIALSKAEPMLVVMPNGNMAQEAAPGESSLGFVKPTMKLPNTMDGKMEQTFNDVIHFIESNYRVVRKKSHRAIAALSMGGFHSLHISRHFPYTFDYVGLFSAAIFSPAGAASAVYKNRETTLTLIKANRLKLYWIAIGKTDFLFEQNVIYLNMLHAIGMSYVYRESEGRDTWDN